MPSCRNCTAKLTHVFADLGISPASNDYRKDQDMQTVYPLKAYVCENCKLVQLPETVSHKEIFSDYLYFSSASPTWVADRKALAIRMINELKLDHDSLVVDVASNDGYYLKHFREYFIPVLGVEPAANVAKVAVEAGVPTDVEFFGQVYAHRKAAACGGVALLNATNVLAHVPNIHDFVEGVRILLAPDGVATFEFPSVLNLIKYNQLDTIYHEHYSYLSATVVKKILLQHGLHIWRIEEVPTHGGSYRIFACREEARWGREGSVDWTLDMEAAAGVHKIDTYATFHSKAMEVRKDALHYLLAEHDDELKVVGYGAPAKCTTFCNYVGIDKELVQYVVDDAPAKQGCFVPGTNIPIVSFEHLRGEVETVNTIVVFPWNLVEPITEKIRQTGFGGEIVTFIPSLKRF